MLDWLICCCVDDTRFRIFDVVNDLPQRAVRWLKYLDSVEGFEAPFDPLLGVYSWINKHLIRFKFIL